MGHLSISIWIKINIKLIITKILSSVQNFQILFEPNFILFNQNIAFENIKTGKGIKK